MSGTLDLAELDEALEALLEQPAQERERQLQHLQQQRPALAAALRKLLRLADEAATDQLLQLGERMAQTDLRLPPPQIPGYRIEGEIGSGGMATVYAALRDVHGLPQPVAIKLLRTANLSAAERERFLNEQRILARLRHPHIATLLDVGVVDGRPYMVMERIEGDPIDQRLRVDQVGVAGLLECFLKVLDAVALAHAHFVIHRDIKPDNVLIDQRGQPRLIDFGIAKVLDDSGGLRADPTQTGLAPMTLRYASPEQLSGQPVGIGSDIYQLGLLLYQLLTAGGWPWDEGPRELPAQRQDAQRLPHPASTRVAERSLRRALRGDLDSILLKCLRHEPRERYASVAELRADLERHLQHRPVRARQQTRGYLLQSFVRRHRLGVALGAMAALLVLLTAIGALLLAARAQQYAERSERLLDSVTTMLVQANPYARAPGTVSVNEVVAQATQRLLDETPTDPAFSLQLLERYADLQGDLQQHTQQLALLQRAESLLQTQPSGATAETRARIQAKRIEAQALAGDQDGALAAIEAWRQQQADTERLRLDLVEAAIHSARGHFERAENVLAGLQDLPGTPLERYRVQAELATVQTRRGEFEQALATLAGAEPLLDPAELSHQAALLRHRYNVATVLGQSGRYRESVERLQALLDETRARLGPDHVRVLTLTTNLAVMLAESGRLAEAHAAYTAISPEALAAAEPNTRIYTLITRAGMALHAGAWDSVLDDLLTAVQLATEMLGADSPRLAYPAEQLAWALYEFGHDEFAAAVALRAWRLSAGERHMPDLLLQLLADGGLALPGRPDPAFAERMDWDCDRVHYDVLRQRIHGIAGATHEAVPADCSALYGMRLEALGLPWQAQPEIASERRLNSPILQRARGMALPDGALPQPLQQRLQAWLRQVQD